MSSQEIVEYIKSALASGKSKEVIVSELTTHGGWTAQDVEKAFNAFSSQPEVSPLISSVPGIKTVGIIVVTVVIIGVIAGIGYKLIPWKTTQESTPNTTKEFSTRGGTEECLRYLSAQEISETLGYKGSPVIQGESDGPGDCNLRWSETTETAETAASGHFSIFPTSPLVAEKICEPRPSEVSQSVEVGDQGCIITDPDFHDARLNFIKGETQVAISAPRLNSAAQRAEVLTKMAKIIESRLSSTNGSYVLTPTNSTNCGEFVTESDFQAAFGSAKPSEILVDNTDSTMCTVHTSELTVVFFTIIPGMTYEGQKTQCATKPEPGYGRLSIGNDASCIYAPAPNLNARSLVFKRDPYIVNLFPFVTARAAEVVKFAKLIDERMK